MGYLGKICAKCDLILKDCDCERPRPVDFLSSGKPRKQIEEPTRRDLREPEDEDEPDPNDITIPTPLPEHGEPIEAA